jgi:threonine dehydrogenase-like Zn-dependent dehydrogenase
MKTIVLEEPGRFALHDTPAPDHPAPGEALVRIHRVGVCGTDLHAFAGRQPFFNYPRILGHELGVEVLAIGAIDAPPHLAVGDRCCIQPYLHCGACSPCRRGATNCCERLQTLGVHTDGGMRETITIPLALLHPSATLSYEQLAIVEMLCIGAHAVRRATITPGERALVVGIGPIGLGAAVFARAAGAEVLVMDVSERRLEFARRQGFAMQIDGRGDVAAQLRALCGDDPPTVVFDATGNAQSMMRSFAYPANHGRLVFVGLFQGDVTFNDPEFHRRELTLLASRNATAEDFRHVVRSLETGAVVIDDWISVQATPEAMIGQFAGWTTPEAGIIKAMVTFDS